MDDPKKLQQLFNTAIDGGAKVSSGTSYFAAGDGLTEGNDVVLPTTAVPGKETIEVRTSATSDKMSIYYKMKSGRWVSKSTLFGRHYLNEANASAKVPNMICRTSQVGTIKSTVEHVPCKDGHTVSVFCFTEETPISFKKADKVVYIPDGANAWDAYNRTMNVTKKAEEYILVTLGTE